MTMTLGLIFAVLCAAAKAADTLINKQVMKNTPVTEHILLRIIFVCPILFAASVFNWHIEAGAMWYLLAYGVLEAINICAHQFAVKRSDPLHVEIVSKSKVFFVLILSIVLMVDTLSLWSTVGIAVFMCGVTMTINFRRERGERTGIVGVILECISVLARTFKPFILKACIKDGLVSNETMAALSMVVAFVILYAVFRPKLNFRSIDIRAYTAQAGIVASSMLLSGWAVILANTVIVNAIEGTSAVFVMAISYIAAKKKYPPATVVGCIISVIGILLAILL